MKKFSTAVLVMISFAAAAQQPNADLKNLINRSFSYFPKFRELEQTVVVNRQRVELAALGNRPVISASGLYNYMAPVPEIPFPDGNGNVKDVKFQPNHNFNTGINVSAPIYNFGRTKLAIERAKLDVQQSQNTIEYNKAQLAAQVATIYYTIIYLQKAIAVQDTAIAVLEANRRLMENKFKNGDALKIDVLTLQNNIDLEQNRKVDLQNNLEKQYNLLQYAAGQNNIATVSGFDFAGAAVDQPNALKAAQTNNVEYAIAQQRIRQAETDLALSKLSNRPSLNINGGTGFRNGYQPQIQQMRFNYAIGMGVSVPIYNGGRTKKQVQLAQSAVTQNELAVESLNNQYQRDIAQAVTDVRSNEERAKTAEEQILIAREALRLAQSRYNNGISTQVELLNANANLQKVELSELQYRYQLALAHIELARLTGVTYW